MATVALAVGAIPEELPAVTMITRCVRQRTLRRISFSLANRLQYLDSESRTVHSAPFCPAYRLPTVAKCPSRLM